VERYAWNCRASAALFELIGWFEVAWRNNIDQAICASRPPRAAVMDRELDRIMKLRNRIAHHEPIGHVPGVRPPCGT
jgi:hypothetical protein